jgi:hypothetical protein
LYLSRRRVSVEASACGSIFFGPRTEHASIDSVAAVPDREVHFPGSQRPQHPLPQEIDITVTAPPGVAGHVLVRGDVVFTIDHLTGHADEVGAFLDLFADGCDNTNAGDIRIGLGPELPTSRERLPISISARFPIAAGATETFYLNALKFFGPTITFYSAAMDTEFNPD